MKSPVLSVFHETQQSHAVDFQLSGNLRLGDVFFEHGIDASLKPGKFQLFVAASGRAAEFFAF